MKNIFFFILFLLLFHYVSLAQFNGGNGDGYNNELYAEITLNNDNLSLLYLGSSGDGYSENSLYLTTLNAISEAEIYIGGNGDGFNATIKAETNLDNISLVQLYLGSNGDGYAENVKLETNLNNISLVQLYLGSNGDGYAQNLISETTLSNLDLTLLYLGNNGDGYADTLLASTTLSNLDLTLLYLGSNGDGYADTLLASTTLSNLDLALLYLGSNGDGYADTLLASTTLTNLDLALLYLGSNGDGYAQNLFAQTTLNNLSLALLYSGSNGDGYADNILASTTLSNITLAILFGGGNGDGFAKSLYFQNPLCDRSITVWNGGVWSNGVPNNTIQTIIDDTYDTNLLGNLNVCSCIVRNGASLLVRSNNYVRVVNDIVNNGDFDILHQGSLVQNNNDASVTGSGTFTTRIETTPLIDANRFTYFSSPVENQDLNVFSSFANMSRLWRFNEAIQDWYLVNQNDVMIPAIGYIAKGAPDVGQYPQIGNADFDGPFNNGIFSYPLTFNVGGISDDNSLVGNPYPSAINATLLLNNNLNANAFYFWTHDSVLLAGGYAGDDYAVWNNSGGIASGSGSPAPSGFIASGQGFFVDAVGPGNLVFNNSIRVTGNNDDFRNTDSEITEDTRDRIWLNLTHENGLFNQILINFSNEGSTSFDSKLDATRYNTENPISFYSNGLNDELFAIQALPVLTENDIVSLGFDVIDASIQQLKISIDHLENFNDVEIYLKDKLLNVTHNIEAVDYDFSISQTGNFNNRFELVFNQSALNTNEDILQSESLIVANQSENEIFVKTKKTSIITTFKAYDVLGKLVIDLNPNKASFVIKTNINQGTVLFIKAKLENGSILKTKFIKL